MTFRNPLKEVYIRLVENEPVFVCTVRYGGFLGKSTEVPLKSRPEASPEIEEQPSPILRARNRFGASAESGAGEQ
jgi:hypothetical protein